VCLDGQLIMLASEREREGEGAEWSRYVHAW
jgi:hypothetical protein